MSASSGLLARAIHPLLSGLRAIGQDADGLLAEVGLSESSLADPETRVSHTKVHAFLDAATARTGDPALGVHLAESAELSSFDLHAYAMLASPTLGAAYERMCRYQRMVNEAATLTLVVEGDRATLRHALSGGRPAPAVTAEFLAAAWVRIGRELTGQTWAPIVVGFAHDEPEDATHHERFFGTRPQFSAGATHAILDRALLSLPSQRADAGLLSVLDRHAREVLDRLPSSERTADRVRAILAQQLTDGPLTADVVAKRLGMSARTLQRRLADEQTTLADLLDHLRSELALGHLRDGRYSLAEIAFLLGFSNQSAFQRAFKRWTDETPAEARARLGKTDD